MSIKHTRQTTGILFILGAVLVNIPYTLLIMNFDYPDILRKPAGEILERFAAGGSSLTWTWLSFAWVGLPLLFAILLLPKVLNDESPLGLLALFFGAVGAFVQMVGLPLARSPERRVAAHAGIGHFEFDFKLAQPGQR